MSESARFFVGFCLVLLISALFNVFSVARMWVDPGCYDCLLAAGVPFPFVAHGGLVTVTFVIWRGALENVAATGVVALLFGVLSERLLRR
jgi:hypothetical protein